MKTFEERLQTASADWLRDGVITDAQRTAILQRHPPAAGGGARFIGIVATIGGLLFAVGVSLIIKANWQAIGDWVKIGGLVALLVAAYATGWRLKVRGEHFAKTGDACLMIGQILFLCGIALVSQIFHLNDRPATGVLIWWAGIALVPWLTRAKGAQFVSIGAALLWFGMEMTTRGSWIEVASRASGYGHDEVTIQAAYFLLGVGVWAFGMALRGTRFAEFAGLHEKWGLLVACAALFMLGFARHEWSWSHQPVKPGLGSWLAFALPAVLAGAALVAAHRACAADTRALLPWLAAAVMPVVGVMAVGPLGDGGWLWSGLAWLSLFALSVAVVRIGLETGREGWVNLGILFVAANVIARYFDLFGTMLEGGVFFIVTGLLITGLGIYLERKRRALVATLRKGVQS